MSVDAERLRDVRCPTCARLLARRAEGRPGAVVHCGERSSVYVRDGEVECLRCGSVVVVQHAEVFIIRLGGKGSLERGPGGGLPSPAE